MPHKHGAERRHHIPEMQFKLTNWALYEAGLRRRRERSDAGQRTEAAVGAAVLNRMLAAGRTSSVRSVRGAT